MSQRPNFLCALAVATLALACSARGSNTNVIPETDVPAANDSATDATTPVDTTTPTDSTQPPVDVPATPEDRSVTPEDQGVPPADVPVTPEDRPATAVCGDGTCNAGSETCTSCSMDCGPCPPPGTGYRRVDTAATFVNACALPGVQRILVSADDGAGTVTVPFSINFFGVALPTPVLQVSSNGFITAVAFDAMTTFYGTIPSTTEPNGLVAAYWADLVLGTDGVCAASTGSAPARHFVVQWRNAQFYSGVTDSPPVGTASFEVIYNEEDSSFDYLYETITGQPMVAPSRAAVGIENVTGTGGVAICTGGRTDATPAATDCTAVTTGTRFRLVPST